MYSLHVYIWSFQDIRTFFYINYRISIKTRLGENVLVYIIHETSRGVPRFMGQLKPNSQRLPECSLFTFALVSLLDSFSYAADHPPMAGEWPLTATETHMSITGKELRDFLFGLK